MTRCVKLLIGVMLALSSQMSLAFSYQDMWTDPSKAGSSMFLAQQGNTLFVGWATFSSGGLPSWVYMVGTLNGNSATLPINNVTGQFVGSPQSVVSTPGGTATLTFTSDATATMSYALTNGASGTLNLQRFTVAPAQVAGTYRTSAKVIYSGCATPANNGTAYQNVTAVVSVANGILTMRTTDNTTGAYCDRSGAYTQVGATVYLNQSVTCSSGSVGNGALALTVVGDSFDSSGAVQYTNGEKCRTDSWQAGTRQ